ncbi:hypothetical protein V5799_011098 [Amblyomma americanum]|uniref:Secreted protein n=1 Tax=Amblyomma americanum TaxID=6943 RepID=A0AAQ4EHY9_AMBAM
MVTTNICLVLLLLLHCKSYSTAEEQTRIRSEPPEALKAKLNQTEVSYDAVVRRNNFVLFVVVVVVKMAAGL